MSAPCRGRWKKETWTSASHFLNSQAPTPPHISCLFQTVSFHLCTALWPFFFYSFDFSSLDLISASPPTDPDPICAPFLLLPSSSLYSAPCGWLGNGKCWAPLYNYNQGAREHTHKHTCPSSLWALLPLRKKKKWMDARRHFLSPFSFCPRNFDSSHGGLY